jgi:hypothetical protein
MVAIAGQVQTAGAQDVAKIGIIGQFTGPFAVTGEQYRQGLERMVVERADEPRPEGGTVYRDTGGPNRRRPSVWRKSCWSATRWRSWAASSSPKRRRGAGGQRDQGADAAIQRRVALPDAGLRLLRAYGSEHLGAGEDWRRMGAQPG